MSYKLTKKVTITNLITNPEFTETTGWSGSNCTISYYVVEGDNNNLQVNSSTGSETIIYSSTYTYMNQNHIYYASIEKFEPTTYSDVKNIQFYWPEAEPSMGNGHITNSSAKPGGWYRYSVVDSRTNWSSGNQKFRFDFENGGAARTAFFYGVILIDLTECFGSGKEPPKDWCDSNIPAFTGTYVLDPFKPVYYKNNDIWKPVLKVYQKNNGIWTEPAKSTYQTLFNSRGYKNKSLWEKKEYGIDVNTKLLLHCDDYTDSSSYNRTITVGNKSYVVASTTAKFNKALQFGKNSSGYIDITIPELSDIIAGDFTIDFWDNRIDKIDNSAVFVLGTNGDYSLLGDYYSKKYSSQVSICASSNGSSWDIANNIAMGNTVNVGSWVHRAIVKKNNTLLLFENGTLVNSIHNVSNIYVPSNNLRLGVCCTSFIWGMYLHGYVDEFRISSIARWTENFTPQTEPYSMYGYNKIGYVESENSSAYPDDGLADDGYYYKRL